ncbi:MAG TPA: ASPIC/UnbV domain-containing protein, partial [Candidatus Sulfotelmatobacter sp.]|nr:ASPIC/UnbV domain-containing protein [Candidatus Sulfotelmatobacter sp.]
DGIGAVVKVSAGSDWQSQMMRSGSSYLSASELVLTYGLAQHDRADTIEIRWPSGQLDKLSNVAAGQTITVKEGKGITSTLKYGTR